MTLFRLIAVACLVIAIICAVVPTTVGVGPTAWIAGGLLAWILDGSFGSPLLGGRGTVATTRQPQ